jgi:cation diffusion facilitator CzcD-associated flavoprotein CzcO
MSPPIDPIISKAANSNDLYSQYTWARNPNWSHFYSSAPEIWQYLRDVVDRFGLMKYFKLSHEIVGAYWDNDRGVWDIHVRDLVSGETFVDSAEVFINGAGLLKSVKSSSLDYKPTVVRPAGYLLT